MKSFKDLFTFSKSQILAFVLGIVGVFIIFTFQAFDIRPAKLISPLIQKQSAPTIKHEIKQRLTKFENNYTVKSKNSIISQVQADVEYEQAHAYAAIDFDSGEVLVGKDVETRLPIASLTKIMSAVVALDLASANDQFTISSKAASQIPTKIGVVTGEKMSVSELLNAALLTSANDAVEVLRDGIDKRYGQATFISAMNEKANILGLEDTHFSNPQGFDSSANYSSVHDLAILSHYALTKYPLISEIAKKDYQFLPEDLNHKQFDLYNWNGLIGVYPETVGLKIGNTGKAKYTTIVLSQREGKKILSIVLGAPEILKRDLWASQILDAGYQISLNLTPVNLTDDELISKYRTWKYFN